MRSDLWDHLIDVKRESVQICCRHNFQLICQNPIHTGLCLTLWGEIPGAFPGAHISRKADGFLDLCEFLAPHLSCYRIFSVFLCARRTK